MFLRFFKSPAPVGADRAAVARPSLDWASDPDNPDESLVVDRRAWKSPSQVVEDNFLNRSVNVGLAMSQVRFMELAKNRYRGN